MGGYQVGSFPAPWREWNGKYRDAIRRYWKGDDHLAGEIGYRLAGSADLYQGERRRPQASINFVTAHDGFTLHDLVSYSSKHNEANGEWNKDGADDNQAWNHGVEGETDDPAIIDLRERQKRNLLATPMFVPGRAHAGGGRRDGPHPGGQQQRLLPGQRDLLARLEPRRAPAAAAGVHPAADRLPPRQPRAAAAALLPGRIHLGLALEGSRPGSGPTARR